MATDTFKRAKLDRRRNIDGLTIKARLPYESPEAAREAWERNRCGLSESSRRMLARSVKAGRPVVVYVWQPERSPDGRMVEVAILSVDLRVTPL